VSICKTICLNSSLVTSRNAARANPTDRKLDLP
jgi:hypothetical protein